MSQGKVIVHRGGGYQDALRAYKILVDGKDVGKIKANKQEDISLAFGQHTIQFKIDWMASPTLNFQLSAEKPEVRVECSCTSKAGSGIGIVKSVAGGKENYIKAWIEDK
jgi:hypothetical protein